jgi:hypothetical protein
MKSYQVAITFNDIFTYDCTLTANNDRELLFKLAKLLENLDKVTIEQLSSISIIVL